MTEEIKLQHTTNPNLLRGLLVLFNMIHPGFVDITSNAPIDELYNGMVTVILQRAKNPSK